MRKVPYSLQQLAVPRFVVATIALATGCAGHVFCPSYGLECCVVVSVQ